MNGSGYKKIRAGGAALYAWATSSADRYIIACFILFSILLLSGILTSFWMAAVSALVLVCIIHLKVRNLFISGFLVYLFSLPVLLPNKFYSLVVIPGWKLFLPHLKIGLIVQYGVLLAHVLLACCLLFVVRDLWRGRKKIPWVSAMLPILLPAVFFGLFTLPTASYRSPLPTLSLTWTIQYMQYYVVAFLVVVVFIMYRTHFRLLYTTVLASLGLEFAVGMLQFIRQSSAGLPIETTTQVVFSRGLDENNAIYRISGTLFYSNQLALIAFYFAVFLFLALMHTRKTVYGAGIAAAGILVLLTQSRSVWISLSLIALWAGIAYKKELALIFRRVNGKRLLLYGALFAAACSYIYIPRILLSFNTAFQGTGPAIREKMIEEGVEAFLYSPLLGYGAGTNEYILNALSPKGYTAVFPVAVHMALLQLTLEVGLAGVFFWILPLIMIVRTYINTWAAARKRNPLGFLFLQTSVFGIVGSAIYYLVQPHVGIIEFPYLGLLAGIGFIGIRVLQSKPL